MASHLVQNRVVWTYQPGRWPEGAVTAYEEGRGAIVEHVVVFPHAPQGTLAKMLSAGLEEAHRRYEHIRFGLPHEFPLTPRLRGLAERLGFQEYDKDAEMAYFVVYFP